ncbi:MAG: hypothetical protein R3234_03175 [Thermoanaerobaculia bacterium]|nr:hypothetical protein [Thermoanaerobaculia bacterium]
MRPGIGLRAAWTSALFLTVSGPLFAAVTEPGEAAGEHEADTWMGIPRWIILTLNLVVFFGILIYFAGPAVAEFLQGKQEEVDTALREAERQRAEAERMSDQLKEKIEDLRAEMADLRSRAEREGRREREEILREAARERERVKEQTKHEISHRLDQAREELTRHAVALASDLAERKLSSELTEDDKKRLFERNLVRLEQK